MQELREGRYHNLIGISKCTCLCDVDRDEVGNNNNNNNSVQNVITVVKIDIGSNCDGYDEIEFARLSVGLYIIQFVYIYISLWLTNLTVSRNFEF